MNAAVPNQLHAYAVEIRRKIHAYLEIGFDLPVTAALVAGELKRMCISHTDRYGTCSSSDDLGQGERCIALRADIDALSVEEKADLPLSFQNSRTAARLRS